MASPIRPLEAAAPAPIESLDGRRLLLLLHGYGADERDLLPVVPELGTTDAVIALRGPIAMHPGAAWADGTREAILSGADLDRAADDVLAFLDALPQHGLGTPAEVDVLGFSQGGGVAITMARRAPGRVRRLVLLAAFVPTGAEAGDAALAADPPPVFWGRGAADPVIPPEAVARTEQWLATHARATTYVEPGLGHGISAEELERVAAFLA